MVITAIKYNVYPKQITEFFTPGEFIYKERKAINFELKQKVEFNFQNKNFFKLEYKQEGTTPKRMFLLSNIKIRYLILTTPNLESIKYDNYIDESNVFEVLLSMNGTYYFEFIRVDFDINDNSNYYFTTFIPGEIIDNINLSEKSY